ncbi:MAG: Ni/Fe-hydrogenase, b-type cytochrome subunit [Caldimonas sp.]
MNSRTIVPTYIWEVPVRIWHWVMAACMVVLAITGYLIGSPLSSSGGEAVDHFFFGYIRFAHFAAGLIFAVVFAWRVIWAFFGNQYSREIFLVPLKMLTAEYWRGFFDQVKYYLFIKKEVRSWMGHNPLAMSAMAFMYALGALFMIFTGLALYGEGLGENSWIFKVFSSWVLPLLGYSQNVHTLHNLGMWFLIVFTIAHIYMVIREDICSEETVVSTMINGWRVAKR